LQPKRLTLFFQKDGQPYPEPDAARQWGKDFEDSKGRTVGKDELLNGLLISTVWLGIDHSYGQSHRPQIFESMVFFPDRSGDELEMWRYATWEEAERGHKTLVKKYRTYKTAEEVLKQ